MIINIHLYRHFNQTQNNYVIATEENEGYDYAITWKMWQSFISESGLPVYIWNASEYYGGFFSYSAIQAHPLDLRPLDPDTGQEIFIFESGGIESVVDFFFLSQARALQDQINSKLDDANSLINQADRISLTLSLTTIGVIISTAMVNRLNQKKLEHEFAILNEKEGRPNEKKWDLISIPVLIIAIVLSIIGVVFPLILNLIGV